MGCSTSGFPVYHQFPELTQTLVHQVSDTIQPSHPLSSPSPPTLNLAQHKGLFQWVSSSHQVAKVLEFSFSISPSNEYSGLISFRIDWLDLLATQRTLQSLLQHHSSKASILQGSAFFILQLLYPYMTTGKTPNSPPYCIAQGTLLSVMWQPGWEGSLFSFLNNRLSPQGTPTKALPPPL